MTGPVTEEETPVGLAPEVDIDSAWWWQALDAGQFMLPLCRECGRHFFPPISSCTHCGAQDIEHVSACGGGSVYSWIVVHIPQHPVFEGTPPYTILAVDLAEGPRIFGRLLRGGPVQPGAAVQVPQCGCCLTVYRSMRSLVSSSCLM